MSEHFPDAHAPWFHSACMQYEWDEIEMGARVAKHLHMPGFHRMTRIYRAYTLGRLAAVLAEREDLKARKIVLQRKLRRLARVA